MARRTSSTLLDRSGEAEAEITKGEPQIRYRFTQDGAEWAMLDNGHYRVLRCGEIVVGARVRLRIPGLRHRVGDVRALLPGWGYPCPVNVLVELDLPAHINPECPDPKRPTRFYRPEQLEVLKT